MSCIVLAFPVSRRNFSMKVREILYSHGFHEIIPVNTGAEALQEMNQLENGILITCTNLPDMYYRVLLDSMPECFELLLLDTESVISSLREEDVIALPLPIRVQDLTDTVLMMDDHAEKKLRELKKKRKTARQSQDRKEIDTAKMILMDRNRLSEEEAYRYLQKTSMDTGRTMAETAQMIILLSGQ